MTKSGRSNEPPSVTPGHTTTQRVAPRCYLENVVLETLFLSGDRLSVVSRRGGGAVKSPRHRADLSRSGLGLGLLPQAVFPRFSRLLLCFTVAFTFHLIFTYSPWRWRRPGAR